MKFIPFPNQIHVKPITSKGILGETQCAYGKVMAIGNNVDNVKLGDVIAYEKYGLKEVTIDKEEVVVIHKDSDFLLGYVTEI